MEAPQPTRDEVKKRALALPLSGVGETIDEKTALAILDDLERNGSSIPEHLREQIAALTEELGGAIEGEVTPQILRGIVARAAIAGAAQVVSDTGQTFLDIESVKQLLGIESEHIPITTEPPAA